MKLKTLVLTTLLIICFSAGLCSANKPEIWKDDTFDFTRVHTIGLQMPTMPDNNDQPSKIIPFTLLYAMDKESGRCENVKFMLPDQTDLTPDCYIKVSLQRYNFDKYWHEPSASASDRSDSHSYKVRGKNGKDITETETRHWTEIDHNTGYSSFTGIVEVTFQLIDAKTNKAVYSYYRHDDNEKRINAFYYVLKDFYSKLNKQIHP